MHFETDLNLRSRFPLVLARIYNSLDPESKLFGRGWSSPVSAHLAFSDSDVVFTNSDGSRSLFRNENSEYIGPEGSPLDLKYNSGTGFYTISHPHGAE
jgi:hypothetical protein